MFALFDLWDGNIHPAEDNCPTDQQYRTERKALVEQEDLFWKELSPAGKAAYEAFQVARDDLLCRDARNAFVQGFRLGARLLLDVLSGEGQQKGIGPLVRGGQYVNRPLLQFPAYEHGSPARGAPRWTER